MRNTRAALTSILFLWCAVSLAATDPNSWNRQVERLDFYTTNPNGGDNAFFTYVADATAGANVVLLYPATFSMREFTQKLYKIRVDLSTPLVTGCDNAYLSGLTYFMPSSVKPPSGPLALDGTTYNNGYAYVDPATYTTSGQADGLSTGASQYYRYGNWPAPKAKAPVATTPAGVAEGLVAACDAATTATNGGVADAATSALCQTCLGVTGSGYWLNPRAANNDTSPAAGVFKTNWLRFHPPKWTLLSLAYKRLVNGPILKAMREGVLATNGNTGAQMIQKMLPQSCNGKGRPLNQKRAAIDELQYNNQSRPLAELLFNTAWFMGGQDTIGIVPDAPWGNAVLTHPTTFPSSKSGPCNGCASDFTVLFADGRGDQGNPRCNTDAGFVASCGAAAQCDTVGLGTADGGEHDGDDFELKPDAGVLAGILGPVGGLPAPPAGTCAMDFADDVAKWMFLRNVSASGSPTNITVHVVGVGDPANTYGEMSILREIAAAGGGNYAPADNFEDLEKAIEKVFTTIRGAATSFASSAVTTVQTTGTSSAFIPRFTPAISGPWSGTLSRYVLYNEFAAGCTSAEYGSNTTLNDAGIPLNPNANGSCSDFYLMDKNNKFIQEDGTGNFVLSDDTAPWGPGWPTQVGSDGGTVLATPFWEAGAKLSSRVKTILAGGPSVDVTAGATRRKIFTVAPTGAGYPATNFGSLIPFDLTNVGSITPLAGLGGVGDELCTELAAATGNTYTVPDDCTRDVIRFVHGQDVLLSNPLNRGDAGTIEPRLAVLGDIFHSTPTLVTPPVPKYLCELGVVNQCVPSLFIPTLTPQAINAGVKAYDEYFTTNQYRTEVLLVGSNDGLFHAFNAANDVVNAGVHSFDTGTGNEEWAFIPPDLIPKLVRNMLGERHELMVDGTPMIRDIWVDGSGSPATVDNKKQADEYHTVAIIGERQGGRGYTALDVTNPLAPRFLWSWPKPGTSDAIQMGQTWGDIGGSPPAIGPIAEFDSTPGPLTLANGLGTTARERYVVAFGGGNDPDLIRGRSIHFLDAWTGDQVFRYARADESSNNCTTDPRHCLGSVAAPVSMIDTDSDGLFDYAVVGDLEGQVWTVSMVKAGVLSGGLYNNWFGGRAFEQYKGSNNFALRHPFFQRAAVGMLPTGDLRIYLGSGDRAHLKDSFGGQCGPEDLAACYRRDCATSVTYTNYQISPTTTSTAGHYIDHTGGTSTSLTSGGNTLGNTMTFDTLAQQNASTWLTNARVTYAFSCPGGGASVSDTETVKCDWGATDAGIECPVDVPLANTVVKQSATPTIQNTRFYSIQLFNSARIKFKTQTDADTYDVARLSDNGGAGDLLDVSGCPAAPCAPAIATSVGWYLQHGPAQLPASTHTTDEKTAASSLLFGGCTFWSTLDPNQTAGASGTGLGTCSGGPNVGDSCGSNSDCGTGSGSCTGGPDDGRSCDNGSDCDGLCSGGNDNGNRCNKASDCDGRCTAGSPSKMGHDCSKGSDCGSGGVCSGYGNCSGGGVCTLTSLYSCVGLGSLTCAANFPKDNAWSYQADAITGNIGCGLIGSQAYLTTTRSVQHLVSVAPTQPAPVVSVNSATGLVQYSSVSIDATSSPESVVLGSTEISSTVHWLEVPRKVHDCRHGNNPGADCN